ncbi:hypothetical protein MMC25_003714 [Agyrium rufum]|nr:hypothetical protein [Agyrium rufum]
MPPRKEKPEKGEKATKAERASVDDAATVKILKDLHEANLIAGKSAGKQTVYHALQPALDPSDPSTSTTHESLAALDTSIVNLRNEITALKQTERQLKLELSALSASVSTSDLKQEIETFEKEEGELKGRLSVLKGGDGAGDGGEKVKGTSADEKDEVEREWKVWARHAATRKKIAMELWGVLLEGCGEGRDKDELWEELGLEGDE